MHQFLRDVALGPGLEGAAEILQRLFVEVVAEPPQTRWVVGSNRALVTAFLDERTGTIIAQGAIDNLVKGAAGQAVQAANLALGFPETAGLPVSGWMP